MGIPVMTALSPTPEAIIQLVKCRCRSEGCSTNAVSAAKQGCYERTSAAVPMVLMNVRINCNKANVTMMTAILRMKRMMMMR